MSIRNLLACVVVAVAVAAFVGCGKGDRDSNTDGNTANGPNKSSSGSDTPMTPDQIAKQTEDAYRELNQGKTIKAVDSDKLKALLPDSLAGLKRGKASGENVETNGMSIAMAEVDFSSDDGKSIRLKIQDVGPMSGAIAQGMVYWANGTFNRKTDDGFERTAKIDGYPAMEKFVKDGQRTHINLWVGNRFLVELEGDDLPFDTVKGCVSSIPLSKLAAMKDEGVSK